MKTVDYSTPLPNSIEKLGFGERTHTLIRICLALQAHAGSEPFFLSARQAGQLLDWHFTDASKALAALVAEGILKLVKKGTGAQASRYRILIKHEISSQL